MGLVSFGYTCTTVVFLGHKVLFFITCVPPIHYLYNNHINELIMCTVHAHECVVHMPTCVQLEAKAYTWARATNCSVATLRQSLQVNQKVYRSWPASSQDLCVSDPQRHMQPCLIIFVGS